MQIRNSEEFEKLKVIGGIVARAMDEMCRQARPGMTTRELDEIGQRYLVARRARSAPMLFYKFPGATCISVNEEVAHGIPGDRALRAGDLINVDVSAELDGLVADTGSSFVLGKAGGPTWTEADPEIYRLLHATRRARDEAIAGLRPGTPLNQIGKAIQEVARAEKFSVIRDLGSHGVGRHVHEEPDFIPSFYDPEDRRILKEGMVITVEPFLSTGARSTQEREDGWTLATHPKFRTAQFEHTLVIHADGPYIITNPEHAG